MSQRFRIGADLPRNLVERGVAIAAVLQHAQLPLGLFEQERVWVTTDELFALWRSIGVVSRNPVIGLGIGAEDRAERFSPVAIAMLHTRSFAEALAHAGRYKKLTCPEEILVSAVGAERRARFQWNLADGQVVPETLIDLCFSWIVTMGRLGTGVSSLQPLRVELRRPEGARAAFEAHFGCPILFGAREDAIVFHVSDVERPFVTHDADLLAVLAPHLDGELNEQQAARDVSSRVKQILKRLLAGGRPEVRDVARELRVTSRTLQRRIAGEGRTWQQLLEEARRELSRHYLTEAKLELNEVAFLLGYGDASSFFRAFRQWEGTSPGRWRLEQGMAVSPADARRSAAG